MSLISDFVVDVSYGRVGSGIRGYGVGCWVFVGVVLGLYIRFCWFPAVVVANGANKRVFVTVLSQNLLFAANNRV